MSGDEVFQFVAAVIGVSIGLGALLLLATYSVYSVWQLFHRAKDASLAAGRASLTVEELARRMSERRDSSPAEASRFAELHGEAATLIQQQQQLQLMARGLLDSMAAETSDPGIALEELEATTNRLETTVSEMATSLANLISLLERQRER